MKSKVVNFYGGSGIGKSTTAAHLYAEMKNRGLSCELVREYVKKWTFLGRRPTKYDQIYITGQQAHAESLLYGKVEWIITDSPIWLGPFYDVYYNDVEIVLPAVRNLIAEASRDGIERVNFFLTRNKPFDPNGRFEKDEDEARRADAALSRFLVEQGVEFTYLDCADAERPIQVMRQLGLEN